MRPISLIRLRPEGTIPGAQALRVDARGRRRLRSAVISATAVATGAALVSGLIWVSMPRYQPAAETELTWDMESPLEMPTLDPVATTDMELEVVPVEPPMPEVTVVESPKGLQVLSYKVQVGDTVHALADRYGVSAETIIWANDLADADIIGVDETLEIPPVSGVLHRVRPGDTVADLVQFYGGAFREVLDVNRLEPPFIIVIGQPLMIPGGKVPPPLSPESAAQAEPSEPPLAIPPAATEDQRAFILGHARAAQRSEKVTGIPSSVTLAQAILETYWGTSRLSREAHNYFGIKAREQPGPAGVITFNVWEHVNGRDIYSNEPFRRYNSAAESFTDHGQWFHTWPRYAAALAVRDDPKAFARAINQAGYATDPAYATKLINLMDKFNLYAYDLE
jgi:LysM repeat protein